MTRALLRWNMVSAETVLYLGIPAKPNAVPGSAQTVRLHPGIGVHLHPGSLFGIIPDWRSASSRNRVHFPPESPPISTARPIPLFPVSSEREIDSRVIGSGFQLRAQTRRSAPQPLARPNGRHHHEPEKSREVFATHRIQNPAGDGGQPDRVGRRLLSGERFVLRVNPGSVFLPVAAD
jgi:hypothetical protein